MDNGTEYFIVCEYCVKQERVGVLYEGKIAKQVGKIYELLRIMDAFPCLLVVF